jgi:trk system potassium uptake protein TrkA
MKIIIAGAGSVGRYMAQQLSSSGHTIVVVDNDANATARVAESSLVTSVLGDACDVDVLRSAGASDADVIAAVTGDDEDNLVISLLAKQEFGVPRVVARVNNPNNEWMYNEMWGVDVAVSTPHLLTGLVQEAVTEGSLVRLMSFDHGKSGLGEVTLAENSPAINRTIGSLQLPREAMVVAVLRDGHIVKPEADTVLQAHDEVMVLSNGSCDAEIRTALINQQ